MNDKEGFRRCFVSTILLTVVAGVSVRGAEAPPDSSAPTESPEQMAKELRELKAELKELHEEVQTLKKKTARDISTQAAQAAQSSEPNHPISPSYTAITAAPHIVPSTAASETLQPTQPATAVPQAEVGYNNGFFIQTPDKDFSLHVSGLAQIRYTFADDAPRDKSQFATPPKTGDADGFDARFARLYFFGNAFSPNLTYMITGDFAGDSGNANNFQLVDDYVAWRFNDAFNIRAGAFLVPYSRVEYNVSGEALVDFSQIEVPFDPARSYGVSLFGEPIKNTLTYEFNVNNGPNANHNGRASQVAGATDNRLGLASRWQLFGGSGKPADFTDESDLRKDKSTLAWMLGAAVGYDSLNQSSDAFPGKQPYTIPGVSSLTEPGFVPYPVSGDLYRATVDGEIKYEGWEFTGATYFEQINATPAVGLTLPPGYNNKTSFFNVGYYGQVGYMILPKWEVVGRAGQYYTEGGSNHLDEYTFGLNYFIFGQNLKVQADVTYIPDAAFTSSTDGTSQNTSDFITRLQLQLKF